MHSRICTSFWPDSQVLKRPVPVKRETKLTPAWNASRPSSAGVYDPYILFLQILCGVLLRRLLFFFLLGLKSFRDRVRCRAELQEISQVKTQWHVAEPLLHVIRHVELLGLLPCIGAAQRNAMVDFRHC